MLFGAEMSMVALSCFVVVAYDARFAYDVGQPILEGMGRPGYRFWRFPDNQLGERSF